MNRVLSLAAAALVAVALLAGAFVGGVLTGRSIETYSIPGVSDDYTGLGSKLDEVVELLNDEALEPSDPTSVTAGAISGLLMSSGDKYAAYFDPEHYAMFSEQTDGRFQGIGVNIAERDGGVYVVSVIEGTPAEAAGLKAEDEIVSIDGIERTTWTSDEVVKLVRGPEGSIVKLVLYRPSEEKNVSFSIKRASIDIPNIASRMEGDVGYIRLLTFNAQSSKDISERVKALEAEGATAFVLDVRDNPGGLLDAAVDVSSLFIEDGVIVTVEGRDQDPEVSRARGRTVTDKPLVVLMNKNSASASEVLAGALQDYKRATLVGEQSFGKGSVQTIERLSFGGAVKFTIAHYLTPKGRKINDVGLAPDVVVEMDHELQAKPETDTQLQRALNIAGSKN